MKLALITGGYRRLGAAIAVRLAADGYVLALHRHHEGSEPPEGVERLGDWHGFAADLADAHAVEGLIPRVADYFGAAPTLLVNNASLFTDDGVGAADAASIERHARVNATAPVALALALGRSGTGGAIVNILDQRVRNPVPDQLSYSLSKGALAAATRTLAVALAPAWRVNAVAPGLTLPTPDFEAGRMEKIAALMPLARLPRPEDIADAVAFLAAAKAVTGQILFVDAGASLRGFARDFGFL